MLRQVRTNLVTAVLAFAAVALGAPTASAQDLLESLSDLVKNHKRIIAAEADLASARELIRVSRGGWFPTLDVTSHYGYERQLKGNFTADTSMPSREIDFTITQLLWDFDATDATVQTSRLTYENSLLTLVATRQGLILEGMVAYLDMLSTSQILNFARSSEANIKRQTELEDIRVQRGAGLSTDVLQAKTQLAGAQARRVQAQGALMNSRNRYRAVFGHDVEDVDSMVKPRAPVEMIPETLEEAVEIAMGSNPQLKAALIAAYIARENVRSTKASEFPTFNAIAESKHKEDVAGTIGSKHEQLIKVELTYSLNLGLTASNSIRAAEQIVTASTNRYGDARNLVEEQVRNAWQNLLTYKERAEILGNQANIAGEFLELARKERKLGQRSLIDVLAGETALINASSDAAAAETQIDIALYTLLAAMGHLNLDDIR